MMKVYVDDILVKSFYAGDHLAHLTEMFNIFCIYNMKLNPNKYVFKVSSRKFLGFMVNQQGIEPNLVKIKMEALWIVKEVQRLTARLALLNCFVSKTTNRCLTFFQVLRKSSKFE